MKNIHILAFIIISFITVLILVGCGTGSEESADVSTGESYQPKIQNLIFYGTWEIRMEITPNVPDPSFAWDSTGLKYVVITVFRSRIDIKNNQIANPEDAIWTWNTSMGRGREGNVTYSDGRDMRNGIIQETNTRLAPGTYFIAAWGYSENYDLLYSSQEYKHSYNP
jgi:hypothetical protein